jgi:hypothetical protein
MDRRIMKKIFLPLVCFILLAFVSSTGARMSLMIVTPQTPTASGECDNYLLCQNAEGTGYDNSESYTETGTVDEDYTGTVLRGSQSINLASASSIVSASDFSAQSTIWGFVRVHSTDWDAAASDSWLIGFTKSGGSVAGGIKIESDGTLKAYHGSAQTATESLVDSTTYYVWCKYVKGTGADGVIELYLSENTTRGAADRSNSSGTETNDIINVKIETQTSLVITVDQLYVDESEIGDVSS